MNRDMARAEWQRATQSLRAAELLVNEGCHEDAVSRAYYAILHAAKAALFVHDVAAMSHAAVRRLFGQHLINTGEIERQWSSHLGESFDDRLAADYDAGTVFSSEEAQRECQRTREFVERMQRYLLTNGLTDHDYWFDEDHEVPGFTIPFRYHFCQREAIETLAYLVEVARIGDAKVLIDAYAEVFHRDLLSKSIEFQTTMDGQRQIRRYVPELEAEGVQDLPPEDLWRYAFKMATGSGKTWVMAMAMVWSHFHKKRVPDPDLSTNFLIVAPNVIVYQRLEKDFGSNRICHELPLIPPEWRGTWSQKVILRGESTEPDPSGNLFLTNIHQLYESREQEWTPQNAIEALLGRKPAKDLAASQRSMLERIKELKDLVVRSHLRTLLRAVSRHGA